MKIPKKIVPTWMFMTMSSYKSKYILPRNHSKSSDVLKRRWKCGWDSLHYISPLFMAFLLQSVHIRPWKTIAQHNIAAGRNIKKIEILCLDKIFWLEANFAGKQYFIRVQSADCALMQYCALTKYSPWTKVEWLFTPNQRNLAGTELTLLRRRCNKENKGDSFTFQVWFR